MFTHIMVGANDTQTSKKFYDATFAALGIAAGVIDDRGRVFYMTPTGNFSVTTPINGKPACAANGGTIGFVAQSSRQVDDWHAAGIANGGATCEDPPGVRQSPVGKMYAAYLRDPQVTRFARSIGCKVERIEDDPCGRFRRARADVGFMDVSFAIVKTSPAAGRRMRP